MAVEFSEAITASDLKVSRSRHLIEYMKIWATSKKMKIFLLSSFLSISKMKFTYILFDHVHNVVF